MIRSIYSKKSFFSIHTGSDFSRYSILYVPAYLISVREGKGGISLNAAYQVVIVSTIIVFQPQQRPLVYPKIGKRKTTCLYTRKIAPTLSSRGRGRSTGMMLPVPGTVPYGTRIFYTRTGTTYSYQTKVVTAKLRTTQIRRSSAQ